MQDSRPFSGHAQRLTKVKFNDLSKALALAFQDLGLADSCGEQAVIAALQCVCNVLHFDPDASSYDAKVAKHIKDYRIRKRMKASCTS